jgi:hypothetical protein
MPKKFQVFFKCQDIGKQDKYAHKSLPFFYCTADCKSKLQLAPGSLLLGHTKCKLMHPLGSVDGRYLYLPCLIVLGLVAVALISWSRTYRTSAHTRERKCLCRACSRCAGACESGSPWVLKSTKRGGHIKYSSMRRNLSSASNTKKAENAMRRSCF